MPLQPWMWLQILTPQDEVDAYAADDDSEVVNEGSGEQVGGVHVVREVWLLLPCLLYGSEDV